ncbi:arylsulfatase [Xylaria bambusicola]|uniref:arylsulfatase n=1 Tax=Xylaria bambusicola TaxID=326684 RepID=UPI00200732BA|nr:arylsulfatase [Xylaria bambusicola]KAI0514728.1 arylsulfatase [Xylaria bambusicola]
MTDDQDLHLGSLDYQPILKRELIEKGTTFSRHYVTVAKCCPSRASLLRGMAGHNTNITEVNAPGGNWDKWLISGQNEDYLPHWLTAAGYNAEYIGKIMNGYNTANYAQRPAGWTHIQTAVDQYTYEYNNVVFSLDGETPVSYPGYHQSDVIRAMSLDRIEELSTQDKPFFLGIAPTSPHMELGGGKWPVPPVRYENEFPGLKAPRTANWNPNDTYQQQKASWIKGLPLLNETTIERLDGLYRARAQSLLGVDDIIEDVIAKLAEKNILDNTYIIYTSDNGWHIGNHRISAGKSLHYKEDSNVPFIVRGPGVPANVTSLLPGAHLDLAPTFLDIAGVPPDDLRYPRFLDGRSLLDNWKNPAAELTQCPVNGGGHEVINVEYWGIGEEPSPWGQVRHPNNSYKTLRIVHPDGGTYLYSKWCTGEAELYETASDPGELTNLALNADQDEDRSRLICRLNALLMAAKSCAGDTCRNPWSLLQPEPERRAVSVQSNLTITCLEQALEPKFDDFFASVPEVSFEKCMLYQYRPNEIPYWPENVDLGESFRKPTDNYVSSSPKGKKVVSQGHFGTVAQRNVTLSEILKTAKELTPEQLG